MKKYEILYNGRIQALRDFGDVKKGDIGGYVESEENLSHDGDCWVSGDAKVLDFAQVSGNAEVFGSAHVYGHAKVLGNACVSGRAQVFGNAQVYGEAHVYGDAHVYGNAKVYDKAVVSGSAKVYGDAEVSGSAKVYEDADVNTESLKGLAVCNDALGVDYLIEGQTYPFELVDNDFIKVLVDGESHEVFKERFDFLAKGV